MVKASEKCHGRADKVFSGRKNKMGEMDLEIRDSAWSGVCMVLRDYVNSLIIDIVGAEVQSAWIVKSGMLRQKWFVA